ncbi:MAG: DNA polymerase III subunit alpha, partial [Candidatus Gastranaerophilaceae bacterium]
IERREKAINYVTQKYGEDRVCQIITFGTLAARAALKGVARVLDIPYSEADKWAKMIPALPKTKIDDALEAGMPLKKEYDENPKVKELVDLAKSIEGMKFNVGTHAAGVIISRDPLTEIVPLQRSKDGVVITTYSMSDVEMIGLLKMDFLGLRNLTIIDQTVNTIKEIRNIDLNINEVELDDEATYELLSNGETDGVFQLESSGMKQLVRDLKPSVFEDLGALVALYRPGPLNSGMVKDFVDRKHGRAQVVYDHPSLEPILKDTYGTIVYQEQIMQIAQVLSGYTLGQADILRRAMGKKKTEEMDKQRSIFISGAKKNAVDEKIAEKLFNTMTEFAAYCFNRSHSAAYAFLAYQTAFLKAHYPVEYLSALLSSVSDNQEKTQLYIAECQRIGIKVLPPNVNHSNANFTPDGENIRFGLASIKNVGMGVIEDIEKERKENGQFKSFYDFCTRINPKSLNRKTLESLIKAGALSGIENSRKQLMNNLESVIASAQRESQQKESGQINLFAALSPDGNSVNAFQLSGSDEEYSDGEIQSFEKELLGFYVTSHPLSSIIEHLPFLTTHKITDLGELKENSYVTVCGLISSIKLITTKKNTQLKVGSIEDLTGNVEFVAFSSVLEKYGSLIEPESKVILAGKIQHRGEEEHNINIVVDNVKCVENCNLVDIHLNVSRPYEDIVFLKDTIIEHKGDDPVILNLTNNDNPLKILANSNFWVNASNEFVNKIEKQFNKEVKVEIRSLDCKEAKPL